MRRFIACASLLVSAAGAGTASAQQVADYQTDFRTSGAPAPGWSYLWNANGPIGTASNYIPLVRDANPLGNFETQANGTYPDAPPGSLLSVGPLSIIPGQGSAQAADGIQRYAIAAYTVNAQDLATYGNQGWLDNYTFGVAATSTDGISPAIYVNNTPIISITLPPGIVYDRSFPDAYPVPLGNLSAGDTIYVAIGGGANDTGDVLVLDYSIILIPEPATASTLALAAATLLARRRRRA